MYDQGFIFYCINYYPWLHCFPGWW